MDGRMNKFGFQELRDAESLFVRATVDARWVGSEGLFKKKESSNSCKKNSSRFVVFADLDFIVECLMHKIYGDFKGD